MAGDEGALRDLALEAEALAALSHPVLLRGFDAVLDGAMPHLLVEHLEGPTLRRLLKAEPTLPLVQLIPLGLHVAAGLAYMARAGWVHLDLKPDNLIMGVPPRIIDLSIARTVERAARTRGRARHGRLHGAGAVRDPGVGGPDRARRRRLRAQRDAVARGDGGGALPARSGGRAATPERRFPQLAAPTRRAAARPARRCSWTCSAPGWRAIRRAADCARARGGLRAAAGGAPGRARRGPRHAAEPVRL